MNDSIKKQIIEKIIKLPSVGLYPHVSLESVIKIINDTSFEQPELHYDEWCTDCKEYDQKRHCCPRFNRVIRETVEEYKAAQSEPCDVCESLEEDDTLYSRSEWDGGIGYDYIRDIKFCPKCGRRL